jgi:hypothetical protein
MKRLRGIAIVLGLAGICLGVVLPAYAATSELKNVPNAQSTVRGEIDSLLTPEVLDSLKLSRSQRDSLDELRRRDWDGDRDDRRDDRRDWRRDRDRFDRWDERDIGRLFGLFDVGRRGYDVRIERGDDDNFRTFLALVALGLYISDAQDGYYDYDYYNMMRLDDFLYLFFRILDVNQRRTFTVHFDRWYDNRYIYRRYDRRDWDRWFPRDWDRRLRLDDRQRRDMERVFRDMDDRRWEREKRYREKEKEYFRRSWEDRSGRDREEMRKKLYDARKDLRIPEREVRERVRPFLNDSQRRMLDQIQDNRRPAPWMKNADGPGPGAIKNDH